MARLEEDLGTKLDWVAVDHWNTEHPHVHLIVRGVRDDGQDLVISRDYIKEGMRDLMKKYTVPMVPAIIMMTFQSTAPGTREMGRMQSRCSGPPAPQYAQPPQNATSAVH